MTPPKSAMKVIIGQVCLTAISGRDGVTNNPLTPLDTPTGTCER
jgi:hypothetical protein